MCEGKLAVSLFLFEHNFTAEAAFIFQTFMIQSNLRIVHNTKESKHIPIYIILDNFTHFWAFNIHLTMILTVFDGRLLFLQGKQSSNLLV